MMQRVAWCQTGLTGRPDSAMCSGHCGINPLTSEASTLVDWEIVEPASMHCSEDKVRQHKRKSPVTVSTRTCSWQLLVIKRSFVKTPSLSQDPRTW
jgi:hypothetical protein